MTATTRRSFKPMPAGRTGLYVLLGGLALVVALVAWIGVSLLMPPRITYEIDSEKLSINAASVKKENAKVVPLSHIYEAQPTMLRGRQLRMGIEKPSYCVGLFYFGQVGEAYLASNCSDRVVLLKASAEVAPIVLTPPDGPAFVKALYAARPATFEAPRHMGGAGAVILGMLLTLLLLSGLLVVLLWVGPRRLRYEVVGGELAVQTLTRRLTFPVPGAKVRVHRPLLGDRLAGLSLPGYWVGSWTLDTMATKVFASQKEEGVIVEAEGRIFLTPHDKDGLVAALVEAGAEVSAAPVRRRH